MNDKIGLESFSTSPAGLQRLDCILRKSILLALFSKIFLKKLLRPLRTCVGQ